MIINDGGGNYRPKSVARKRNVKGRNSRKKSSWESSRRQSGIHRAQRRRKKRFFTDHDEKLYWIKNRKKKRTTTTTSSSVNSVARGANRTGKTRTSSPYSRPKVYTPPKKKASPPKAPVRPPIKTWKSPGGFITDHYRFQNSFNFASDATGASLDATIQDIRYEGEVRQEDEYAPYIDAVTKPPVLNLGLTAAEFEALFDASSVEKYAPDGTVYYDVNMDLPNTQGFRQIQVRISEIN